MGLFARSPSTSAFPRFAAGRLLHYPFRGLHSVHFRYGLQTRQVTYVTLYTRGFSSFVTSTTAPIATGRSEPVPGRDCPRCGPAPFHGAREARDIGRAQVLRMLDAPAQIPLVRMPAKLLFVQVERLAVGAVSDGVHRQLISVLNS